MGPSHAAVPYPPGEVAPARQLGCRRVQPPPSAASVVTMPCPFALGALVPVSGVCCVLPSPVQRLPHPWELFGGPSGMRHGYGFCLFFYP